MNLVALGSFIIKVEKAMLPYKIRNFACNKRYIKVMTFCYYSNRRWEWIQSIYIGLMMI